MNNENHVGKRFAFLLSICVLMASVSMAGATELVSVTYNGARRTAGAYNGSSNLSPSHDGRYAAFESTASNLVPDDSNGVSDIFVRDRQNNTTERVSLTSSGEQASRGVYICNTGTPRISGDGRFVAFYSDCNNLSNYQGAMSPFQVFVRDRQNGVTEMVSVTESGAPGNNHSSSPSISNDGRYVVFQSQAFNLYGSYTMNLHLYIRDRLLGTTERITDGTNSINGAAPAFSGDGRYVVFMKPENAHNGNGIYRYDRETKVTERVGCATAVNNDDRFHPVVNYDGRYVAFPSNCTVASDGKFSGSSMHEVFIVDLMTGLVEMASVKTDGTQASSANRFSYYPSISDDGRFVTFSSLVKLDPSIDTNGDYDIYLYDRQVKKTVLLSRNYNGGPSNWSSTTPAISGDGREVAFSSQAYNLLPGDIFDYYSEVYIAGNWLATPPNTPPVAVCRSRPAYHLRGTRGRRRYP